MNRREIILAAVVVAAGIGLVWQATRISGLEAELASNSSGTDPGGELAALQSKVAELEGQLERARDTTGPAGGTAGGGVTALNTGEDGKPPEGGMAGMAKMFEDPAMRGFMKKQMKAQLGVMYGGIIEHLGLEGDAKEAFEDLLVERQMLLAGKGLKLMSGKLSEDEAAALREDLELAKAEMDEQLKESLGEEGFSDFQRYEESANERMEIDSFKEALAEGGAEPLAPEAEEKLMAMMFEERKAFSFTGGFNPDNTQVPEWTPTPELVEGVAADYRNLHERIAVRAGEVLDEQQVGVFIKNQESYRALMETGLRMSLEMFGGGKAGGAGSD